MLTEMASEPSAPTSAAAHHRPGAKAPIALPWVARRPEVFGALNPAHAVRFFAAHGTHGFLLLGSVVLCITGGEALYADMGHFGRRPIRLAWYAVVLPALLINYFGQGAVLLEHGDGVRENPFFGMVSGWIVYPMVAIATAATVVASQALISGRVFARSGRFGAGAVPASPSSASGGPKGRSGGQPAVDGVACIALVVVFREVVGARGGGAASR